jgi:hypothetical protein
VVIPGDVLGLDSVRGDVGVGELVGHRPFKEPRNAQARLSPLTASPEQNKALALVQRLQDSFLARMGLTGSKDVDGSFLSHFLVIL